MLGTAITALRGVFSRICGSSSLLVWLLLPLAADAEAAVGQTETRQAYAKIASYCGGNLMLTREKKSGSEDFASVIANAKELLLDIRSMGDVDPELRTIAEDVGQATQQGIASLEAIKRLPPPPSTVNQFIRNLYYGGTGQFQAAEKYDQAVQGQSGDIQAQIRLLIEAVNRQQAATLMLPRIAKKLSGPVQTSTQPLRIDIDEPWGFHDADYLSARNISGKVLNNCTLVVRLTGKNGEERVNVHFAARWPAGTTLHALYDTGNVVLNMPVGRQTVTLIQKASVSLFCDELAVPSIQYQYAGAERDKDIERYLNHLKPQSIYQPFSKGLLWDTERNFKVWFGGLQFLTKGSVTVRAKRGSDSFTEHHNFEAWKAGDNQWVQTPKLSWDPESWSIDFSFEGTPVTRAYTWQAPQ